jgi:hypothetical protein
MVNYLKLNETIVTDLKDAAEKAFRDKYYLQSAIIIFQTIEVLLRIYLSVVAKSKGIETDIREIISENEISFYKLTLYLNLLDPSNDLLQRLFSFNSTRNNIMHKLFIEYETIEQLETTLESFCMEGVKLNGDLRKKMGIDIK